MVAASPTTLVISIERMYAGAEIAGDQRGHSATVILSRPLELRPGTKALFFGEPRFMGAEITIADAGEIPAAAIDSKGQQEPFAADLQAHRDVPVRNRLAVASTVLRGTVERIGKLPGEKGPAKGEVVDEHDPEFQLAFVRVKSALRGAKSGDLLPIIFSASRDIAWANSPKLTTGEDAIFIAHRPQEEELAFLRLSGASGFAAKNNVVLVTQPYDVLPASDEKRVTNLLKSAERP